MGNAKLLYFPQIVNIVIKLVITCHHILSRCCRRRLRANWLKKMRVLSAFFISGEADDENDKDYDDNTGDDNTGDINVDAPLHQGGEKRRRREVQVTLHLHHID